MISAAEARKELEKNDDRQIALEKCKKWTEDSIREAIKRGQNHCCFASDSANVNGVRYNVESEMRAWLRSLGYRFEPTGIIGGVRQLTEEICW